MPHSIPPPGETKANDPRGGEGRPPQPEGAGPGATPPAELVEGVSRAIADYVHGASVPAGSIDLSREMTLILRQTADQLDSLQTTQAQIADSLADTRQQELSLQTIKSLNYAFRELTDSQERLATELTEQRRRGRVWVLFAMLLSGLVCASLFMVFGFADLREATNQTAAGLTQDRAAVESALSDVRRELDEKTRSLNEGALDFAHLAENLSQVQREKHAKEVAELAVRHDEELFATESRLADVTRDRDIQANSLKAIESSATRTGEAMKQLADDKAELERRVQLAEGRLAAYETERPARKDEIAPSSIHWEPPEPAATDAGKSAAGATEVAPPPSPRDPQDEDAPAEATAAPTPRASTPTAPAAGASLLADLVTRYAIDEGLRVVSADPGDEPGTFHNVVFEKRQGQDGSHVSRRYRGQTARLLLVRGDKAWVRMSGGALTLVGWRTDGSEFSRDVNFEEFDLHLQITDRQAWIDAGAVPMETFYR